MAATNKKCFEKKCLCATCQNICSRCFIDDEKCNTGIKDCRAYRKLIYSKYINQHNYSKVSKEEYDEAGI